MTILKGRPKHTTGQAMVLSDKEFKRVEAVISNGKHAIRNHALLILSFKLGLRIKELACFNDWRCLSKRTNKIYPPSDQR
jgi:site-specific recombinase XerC